MQNDKSKIKMHCDSYPVIASEAKQSLWFALSYEIYTSPRIFEF